MSQNQQLFLLANIVSVNTTANTLTFTSNSNIATSSSTTAGGANTDIQFNSNGTFGGTGNLTFDYDNNTLTLQGHEVLGNIGTTPGTPSNAVAIYNNTIGGGGTGVYVLSSEVNDELVSKSKAIVYAIIF